MLDLDAHDERDILTGWLEAFQRVFGARPALEPFDGDLRFVFPDVFGAAHMLGTAQWFEAYPEMVDHVRGLGFSWGEDRQILTMPTPASFNRRVDACLGTETGWRMGWVLEDATAMSMGPFLFRYYNGLIPAHAATAGFYTEWLTRPANLRFHICSLAHDISVHALAYHMVPASFIASLRAQVWEALPDRVAAWSGAGAPAPLTMGYFLDNDLNRYCQHIWFRARNPAEFAEVFAENVHQLEDALRLRIEETRAGIGDVLSGDTGDMKPLASAEFRLR